MRRRARELCPFAEILKDNMTRHHLSNKGAADIAGVSAASILDWKKGASPTDFQAVSRLADYFGLSLRYMLTGQEEQSGPRSDGSSPMVLESGPELFSGLCEITIRRLIPHISVPGSIPVTIPHEG